jgi:hypothetical protein
MIYDDDDDDDDDDDGYDSLTVTNKFYSDSQA